MSDNRDIEKFRPGAGGSNSGMNPTGPLHGASAPRPNSLGRDHKKPHYKGKPKRPGHKLNKPNKPGTSRPNVRMPNSMGSSASNNDSRANLNYSNNRNLPYENRNNSRNSQGNFNPYNNNSQNRSTNRNSGSPYDRLNDNNRSQGPGLNNFNNNSPNSSNNNSNNGYGSNNSNFNNNHSSMGFSDHNNDNNDRDPSNQDLDNYANDNKNNKNYNSDDPNNDNLSDLNSDSTKDSNNHDDLNNPDSNSNDNQQGDPNDPDSKDNRDPNDTSDETDPNNEKKGNDQDNGLLGKLKGFLTGEKKKKSFGDFLKDEKKRQKEKDQDNNDPAKKAKNLLQRILRLIRRIINLLRLYARAMRLFLMFKFAMMVQSVINWVLGMFNMVISFFISLWTAAVSFLGSIGASILAFLLGGFAIALVFAVMSFFGWYSNQQALNNARQQYYNECIKGNDSDGDGSTEEHSPNSGSSSANLIKGRTPFNIKVKDDKTKDYNKAARNIAQAVHDYLKEKKHFDVPASWFFAQMFAEEGPSITGGTVQPVVSKDFNLAGMSGGYRGQTGTGHAEGDGGYSHYDNWSEFAGDWASYLYKVVFTHKPKSIKDYLNMCIKAHYMTDWSTYYPAMQAGVAFYERAGGAASATGGSAEETDNNDNKDNKCGRIDEDFSGGDIVKEAKKWLGWFHYSQPERMSLLSHWQHPKKDMKTDCSGFVWFVLKRCHVKVPSQPWATPFMETDARGSHKYLKQISRSEAGPGDIIICNSGSGSGDNGHTAILLQKWHGGDTKIIEMGGEPKKQYDIHINIHTINYAFGSLFTDGRVTIARVVHGGKHSSGGGDTDLPKSEAEAKAKIAQAESGGDWNARNGKYVGKYQCDIAYFKGKDWHNHKLQSEVADRYVEGRYGSWKNALKFRLEHDWY